MPEPIPKFQYSSVYDPPAPIIKLKVANPNTEAMDTDDFLVDSGADITLLKKKIFEINDENILGRDVINRWRLLLDGPQEQLSFPT